MNRDWLTLAFGVALVGLVVALSVRQNLAPEPENAEPSVEGATPGAAPEPPAAAESAPAPPVGGPVETKPDSAAPRARTRSAVPAPAPASAEAPAAAAPTGAVLQVQSDVPGASVFLDREFVGTTPLTLRGLPTGSKQLNVTATGHEGYAGTVTLADGPNRVNVEFLKVRLNATLPVVHRHGMGSCQGMLQASPKGVTFDTSNEDDAFTLAFPEIDEFEIDYLKKNLRLRRRGGRTWNFTNESADALFVFHRDVAKAREKLASAR